MTLNPSRIITDRKIRGYENRQDVSRICTREKCLGSEKQTDAAGVPGFHGTSRRSQEYFEVPWESGADLCGAVPREIHFIGA
jgi:hypothetical protein